MKIACPTLKLNTAKESFTGTLSIFYRRCRRHKVFDKEYICSLPSQGLGERRIIIVTTTTRTTTATEEKVINFPFVVMPKVFNRRGYRIEMLSSIWKKRQF